MDGVWQNVLLARQQAASIESHAEMLHAFEPFILISTTKVNGPL